MVGRPSRHRRCQRHTEALPTNAPNYGLQRGHAANTQCVPLSSWVLCPAWCKLQKKHIARALEGLNHDWPRACAVIHAAIVHARMCLDMWRPRRFQQWKARFGRRCRDAFVHAGARILEPETPCAIVTSAGGTRCRNLSVRSGRTNKLSSNCGNPRNHNCSNRNSTNKKSQSE